ncbi:ABC transporter ATP-binding protein [Pararhodobacter aggregans]|nr:ABC transporter ATP-binding protein [Pararhodobacter aggregans]PTX03359.1 amino acid/amide ABC transporter ATP-binding protein 1 (HAAT family) [Pararhodobacter aggregans]
MMARADRRPPLALELREVSKSFGAARIIPGVSLTVPAGEFHAVIGPNGAGKSTLFNLISGRFAPSSGQILLGGQPIEGRSPSVINRMGLSRSFQITNIFKNISVFENIRCALLGPMGAAYSFWRRASAWREITRETERLIEEIGLTARRDTIAGSLSYAEQRLLEVGMTIAGDASVLLLDEPMAGMNHNEIDQFSDFLRRIGEGRTVMMVEHDMNVVFTLADRISVLVYGELIATGTPAEIRQDQRVRDAYLGAEA